MDVYLYDLPKISLNKWYAGTHWINRKRIKDNYIILIKSQFPKVFKKDNVYNVSYLFVFKSKPLDASNCVAMVKLIEDIIFEDDNYKTIDTIQIQSRKGVNDKVKISIEKQL